ncbi:transcriptional regulatory protein BaeR [Mariprofundus micogutta]|uniref:histidine kinase n=1 Tax=Mariprofundus micogutta TaxID=1921010 RepID=A0A1L8CL95_9PROT|nr:response regulator [Mariprofundus micogutta]GAV19690.1 transcriptional regulatory protein BaeR [Mariprofundus micogutta]
MSRTPLILIVGDEKFTCKMLKHQIQSLDCDTLIASNCADTLILLEQHTPELILIDAMMPGSNSMDVITAVRKNSSTTDTFIMMISDSEQQMIVADFLESGADDFLLTPLDTGLFKFRISNILTIAKQHQQVLLLQRQLTECQLKLQRAETGRAEFCQTLAHDLNNVLTGILMGGEVMLMNNHSEETTAGINEIMEAAREIAALIQQRKENHLA